MAIELSHFSPRKVGFEGHLLLVRGVAVAIYNRRQRTVLSVISLCQLDLGVLV